MIKRLSVIAIFILTSLSAHSKVDVYFNHYQYDSYKDPYREKVRRGQNLEKVIVENILKAKKSIIVAVQELRLPEISRALVKKQKEGIAVRVILEANYNNTILSLQSPKLDDDEDHESSRIHEFFAFIDINKDGNISSEEINSRDAIYILQKNNVAIKDDGINDEGSISGLMHHKFVIIDEKIVLLSSANFTMSGVHGDMLAPSSNGNANALLVFESKRAASIFTEEFNLMWGSGLDNKYSKFKLSKPYRGRQMVEVENTKMTIQFSPTSKLKGRFASVNGLIADTVASANESLFMSLFVFSDQRISDYVQERVNTIPSFQVGLLVEPRFAYRSYSEMLDFWGLELLDELCEYEPDNNPFIHPVKNAGTPTLNSGDMLHHKFAVVDGKKVIFGSQNWSYAANYSNDEYLVVIEDVEVAQKFTQEYNRLNLNARIGAPHSLVEKIHEREQKCRR